MNERIVARVSVVNLGGPWEVPSSLYLVRQRFLDGMVPHGRYEMRMLVSDINFSVQLTKLQVLARGNGIKVDFGYDRLEEY